LREKQIRKKVIVLFELLKKNLTEIIEIVNQYPEQYREKCFSTLLAHFKTSPKKSKNNMGGPLQ